MIKRKAISLIIVVAMVISMLPLGAITAFAASSFSPSSPTAKVITGAGVVKVEEQAADNITIKEDSEDSKAWNGPVTIKVEGNVANVQFSSKPTVTVNGSAIASSNVTWDATRSFIQFSLDGDNSKQDIVMISNIKLDLGVVAAGNLAMKVTLSGAVSEVLLPVVAKVQNGLIFSASKPTVDTGNDRTLGQLKFVESATDTVKKDDVITVTLPTGVTFFQAPVANTAGAQGLTFLSNQGTLNSARTEATWTVKTPSTAGGAEVIVDSIVNVASSVAADTDIVVSAKTSSADYTIAPATAKAAKTSAADALTFSAATAPTISNDVNQVAADITIKENKAGALKTGDDTLTVELVSGTFASSPVATPAGAGLTLKNAKGDAVTTAIAGTVDSTFKKATWSVVDQSTAAGSLTISGIAINASSLSDGAVKVKVYGKVVGIANPADAKVLTIANVSTSQTIKLSASSNPALAIGAASQMAGDVIITETKKGAIGLDSTMTVSIFGNTSDKEVLFSEKPTVSVTTGDLEVGSVTLAADMQSITFKVTKVSTTASVIKVSGIKYDINSKAKNGVVQLIVNDDDTRLGAVTNGTIGTATAKFSDVPATHWAFTAVEFLAGQNIVSGRTSGAFDPNASVTRAEFAKMACIAAGLSTVTTASPSFSDIKGHWAEGYIEAAKKAGIIGGYADGTFRPNAKITRAEIAKIVVGAAKFTMVSTGATFSDVTGHWAHHEIITAAVNNVVSGYTDGTFRPNNNATRAEASQMIYKWLVK